MENETAIESAARRSYEWGRGAYALRFGLLVLPLLGCSLTGCGHPLWAALTGAALFVVVSGLKFKGGDSARAVWPGLLAGLVPMSLPLLGRLSGHLCSGSICHLVVGLCTLGGALCGAFVGHRLRAHDYPAHAVALSLLVAALTGALGCAAAGLGGVLGMAFGMLLGVTPAVLSARRAS